MAVKPISIKNFKGGLNLSTSSDIKDNQFSVCKNMFYNQKGQLQTRYGIKYFGNAVGSSKPITSYFFYQRDDNLSAIALCASGDAIYKYDETSSNWSSVKTGLSEYEKLNPSFRTRRDFAVYKSAVYLTNGVDSYAKIDGYTPAYLTGYTTASTTIANWTSIADGSFSITINKIDYDITGINFSTGVTTMADVASKIQVAIRTATGGTETVVWSTDHFVVSSVDTTNQSSISVIGSVGSGTYLGTISALSFSAGAVVTNAQYNPTYTEFPAQPKYRYINMVTDTLFGSGEDNNPSTVYYSAPAPANGDTIDTSAVVIGGDELGRINGMNVLGNIILVLKSGKVYSVDIVNEKADSIDSQTGGFSDRTIANVGNGLVYLTDRGVDKLQQRYAAAGAATIEGSPLDEDVREITTKIEEITLNSNCGWYIKRDGNYFITIDTNGDDIPDTTLVYNAIVKSRTEYTYPSIYDYGMYITKDGEWKYVVASATEDRIYEIESGFDDLGQLIEHEVKSKAFDFGEPGTFKTYDYIDLIGYKNKDFDIDVSIEVDGVVVGGGTITDTMITETKMKETLGVRPIGVDTITGSSNVETVDIYQYVARVPLYATGSKISFGMKSTGGTRTIDSARIGVNGETIDVFGYNNIV